MLRQCSSFNDSVLGSQISMHKVIGRRRTCAADAESRWPLKSRKIGAGSSGCMSESSWDRVLIFFGPVKGIRAVPTAAPRCMLLAPDVRAQNISFGRTKASSPSWRHPRRPALTSRTDTRSHRGPLSGGGSRKMPIAGARRVPHLCARFQTISARSHV